MTTTVDRREIINPHDKITIDYTDQLAAQVAVCVVGEGKYGIERKDGSDEGMPIFLFGGHDEWFTKTHGKAFEQALKELPKARLADALASMRVEGERTSMSDPVAAAHRMADALRKPA